MDEFSDLQAVGWLLAGIHLSSLPAGPLHKAAYTWQVDSQSGGRIRREEEREAILKSQSFCNLDSRPRIFQKRDYQEGVLMESYFRG